MRRDIQSDMLDVCLMDDNGDSAVREHRLTLVKDMSELHHLSRVELAKKAKVQWSIGGDENSSFFHGV